jgi:hypothetical protein
MTAFRERSQALDQRPNDAFTYIEQVFSKNLTTKIVKNRKISRL